MQTLGAIHDGAGGGQERGKQVASLDRALTIVRKDGAGPFHRRGRNPGEALPPDPVIDGSPVRYNDPDTWLPDLLICHHEDAARNLALIAALPEQH